MRPQRSATRGVDPIYILPTTKPIEPCSPGKCTHTCSSCTRHRNLALTPPATRTNPPERHHSLIVNRSLAAWRAVVVAPAVPEVRDALALCIILTRLLALIEVCYQRIAHIQEFLAGCRVAFSIGTNLQPSHSGICHECWSVVNVRAHTGVEWTVFCVTSCSRGYTVMIYTPILP